MHTAHRHPRRPAQRRRPALRAGASLTLAATVAIPAAPAVAAETDPFEIAGGFSVYAREDAALGNHETEGAIAVGGELTVVDHGATYPIVHQVAGTADYAIPTIDGDPTRLLIDSYATDSGLAKVDNAGIPAGREGELEGYLKVVGDGPAFNTYVRSGWTRYRTATEGAPAIDATNQAWPDSASTIATEGSSVAEYVEGGPGVDAVRQCLADLTAGSGAHRLTVAEDAGDRVVLSAVEPGIPNVVDYADITGASQVQFSDGNLPSADAPLIVSVPAEVTDVAGKTFGPSGQVAPYVMWDLSRHDGTVTLDGSGTRVDGSVYAPEADLTVDAAPIDGQIVAENLDLRGGEAHAYFFAGTLPCADTTSSPGSLTLGKTVEGDASGAVDADTAFTLTYRVGDGEATSVPLTDGASITVPNLPAGVEVTIAEPAVPAVDGLEWQPVRWEVDGEPVTSETATVTVTAGSDTSVVAVNTATTEASEPDPTDDPSEEPGTEPSPEPTAPGATEPGAPATDPTDPADDTDDTEQGQAEQETVDSSGGQLPVTGAPSAGIVCAALTLFGAGLLLVLRRRDA